MADIAISVANLRRIRNKGTTIKRMKKYGILYLLIAPVLIYFFVFCYLPMGGVVMAFQDFKLGLGIKGVVASPWVGFDNFERLFNSISFGNILKNTLLISIYKLVFFFPVPIVFAILLNEVKNIHFKRIVQTVTYMPHFLSSVVLMGLVFAVLSPTYGLLNSLRQSLGLEAMYFVADERYFRPILVLLHIWQETGWGAIIYLAAISGIDPGLYEAAIIDGANKFRQIWHITLPALQNLIVILFIMSLGGILNAGFETVFLLYSPPVNSVGDIIDTYVFREALVNANYGFSTAVGLFKSLVGFMLVVITNYVVKRMGNQGIW